MVDTRSSEFCWVLVLAKSGRMAAGRAFAVRGAGSRRPGRGVKYRVRPHVTASEQRQPHTRGEQRPSSRIPTAARREEPGVRKEEEGKRIRKIKPKNRRKVTASDIS